MNIIVNQMNELAATTLETHWMMWLGNPVASKEPDQVTRIPLLIGTKDALSPNLETFDEGKRDAAKEDLEKLVIKNKGKLTLPSFPGLV